MSFLYGFFNAKNLDRVYTAEDFSTYLSSLICNGILDTYGDNFKVSYRSEIEITVGTGKAWIGGHYIMNDAEYVIDMTPYVDASMNRYVTIALCCDVSEAVRDCHIEIIPGVPAENPYPTFPGNDEHRTYLTLATVHLWAASSTPVRADLIYDYRSDESKCGYCRCILGKCKVSEMLDRMTALITQVEQYYQTMLDLSTDLNAIKRRLGMMDYPYPDLDGDGQVTTDEAELMKEYAAKEGAGDYAAYPTSQEKWRAFAEENGLNSSIFPDLNGDGVVDSDDAAIVQEYAANAGAGDYANSAEGFREFMLDYDDAILGGGIKGFRGITSKRYSGYDKKTGIVYVVHDGEASNEAE